jgi:hypothetical protein
VMDWRAMPFMALPLLLVGCSTPPPPPVDAKVEGVGIGYSLSQVKQILGEPHSEMSKGEETLLLYDRKEDNTSIRVTLRKDSLVIVTGKHLEIDGKVWELETPAEEFTRVLGEHDDRQVRWAGWEQWIWMRGKTALKVVFRNKKMASAEMELLPEFTDPDVK